MFLHCTYILKVPTVHAITAVIYVIIFVMQCWHLTP